MPSDGKYTSNGDKLTVAWNDNGDNGTSILFKIQSFLKDSEDYSDDSALNTKILPFNYTSGIKGFHYYVDGSSTGTVTKSHSFTVDTSIEVPTASSDRWLHVAAVDGAGNLSATYTMKIPSVAKYIVNHYVQNEDGSYTLVETEEFMGTIGTSIPTEPKDQTGRDLPTKQNVIVTADGKAHVDYYYDVTRFDITGTVSWNDKNNLYDTRPDNATIRLYKDGEFFTSITVSAKDKTNKYKLPELQKYDLNTGREFVYTVEQDTAYSKTSAITSEDKYVTVKNGYDFLNTIRNTDADKPDEPDPDKPDDKGFYIEGDIYWDDNDDSLGFRPSETTITLYQKGEDGEWHPHGEPIVVDSKTENHYLFDWLPKYWYDEEGVPTRYEYKVEETFSAWYVENGVIKDAYEIHPDTPKDCDFTNDFIFPGGPIIPVNEYKNTLVIKTNVEKEVRIILKPLELFINPDYSVSYGEETGNNITVMTDNAGNTIDDISATRYEVMLDSPEYSIEDIVLSLEENMELEKINGKWYITIKNQPEDAFGTLDLELTKKDKFYQDGARINNYFACHYYEKTMAVLMLHEMSGLIEPEGNEPLVIEYMESDTNDEAIYEAGDTAVILDYEGILPDDTEFIGWTTKSSEESGQISENSADKETVEAEYIPGDNVVLEDSLTLYPVFMIKEELPDDTATEVLK